MLAVEATPEPATALLRWCTHRYYNSLPYAWDLNFNGVGLTRRTSDGTQEGSYSFVAGPGIRKYFNPEGDFFYSGELLVTGNSDFDRPTIDVTPGVGYGRFIRVTPLAQAVRIEQFLIDEGVIKGPLSKETLIAARPGDRAPWGVRDPIWRPLQAQVVQGNGGSYCQVWNVC